MDFHGRLEANIVPGDRQHFDNSLRESRGVRVPSANQEVVYRDIK